MTHSAPVNLIRMLATQRDVMLGNLAKSRMPAFRAVLAAAAARFDSGATYTESGVNEVLRRFLAGAGSMLSSDHVELRRWLVDTGLLARDGFGRRYELAKPPAQFAPMLEAFAGVDLDAVAADSRAAEAIARAARRSRWEQRQGGAQ
jgi:hypothetical protein